MSNQAQILQRVTGLIAETRNAVDEMSIPHTPDFVRPAYYGLEALTEAVELLARLATEPLSDEEALTLVPGSKASAPPVTNESFAALAQRLLAEIGEEGEPDASFEALVERALETLKARRIENGLLRERLAKLETTGVAPVCHGTGEQPADVATFDWDRSFVGAL